MKRSILLAIVAVLVSAVSAFAEKEYNMVITLNNGTTITLGHNDIQNITFNDGEISISGDVMNTIEKLQEKIEQQRVVNELQDGAINDLIGLYSEMDTDIRYLQNWVDNVVGRVSYIESILQNNGLAAPQHSSQTKELPMHIESFNSDQVRDALKSTMEKMHKAAATAE